MLNETINEVKSPERRLNILMPVVGVVTLFSLVLFFIKTDKREQTKQIIYLQQRLAEAEKKIEQCQVERYNESQARINDYKELLKTQETVRKKLKTLSK